MLLPDQIEDIVEKLRNGQVTLLPTQTLWGLSCSAFNEKAVNKISKIKDRKADHPYILLVSSIEMLHRFTTGIHPRVETLLSLHEKPVSVIHRAANLPPHCVTIENTVGIRVTHHPLLTAIIDQLDGPIVSTSANVSGEVFPHTLADIDKSIMDAIDFLPPYPPQIVEQTLDSPSVIISYDEKGEITFLRS